jgi:hypothetical protein
MFERFRSKALEERCTMLEVRCTELLEVSHKLQDENHKLEIENESLAQTQQMSEEMIAHKLKMREESVQLDADKRISEAERKAAKDKDDGISKTKDKYRDKLEGQLEKRGTEMKEMYGQILKRLPDVSMAISKEIKTKG